MNKIDLNKIATINIEKGDTIVIENTMISPEICKKISKRLKCDIILIKDINKIGVIRLKDQS